MRGGRAIKNERVDIMNVVKFSPESYKKCITADDFYKAVDIYPVIKAGTIHSVYQMKINPKTYREIEVQMQSNWRKRRKTRVMGEDRANSMIAFDWMNFSPVQDESIPENEVWWSEK